jgi:hypothetical protein
VATLFNQVFRLTAGTHKGEAAAHAAYNSMATRTYWLMMRYDGAVAGGVVCKGNASAGTYTATNSDNRLQLRIQRDGAAASFNPYDDSLPYDNSWRWLVMSYDVATDTMTRRIAPKGGTLVQSHSGTGGGSGALTSDDSFPLTFGANGSVTATRTIECGFFGITSTVPTLGAAQTVIDDALAATYASVWKPELGDTTSIPNRVVGLPALVLTGATVVAGPDSLPGIPAAVLRRRRAMQRSSLY